jgi:D-alanyl-D-alanine carboxypeptidase/D-alanyl-D-alanine-endopeptidase (penicillin-binding protein 4)
VQWFHTEVSPPLDSLVYWLNRKSINLYGEALLRTIAFQQTGNSNAEKGMAVLKSFWKKQGIREPALNMVDGSGLSPLNRMTTQAQAAILHYARNQDWFPGFYLSIPEYNGMKLKSGTIHGVKGFAGYHTSRAGAVYTISFLVNNYNGSSSELVKKMYAVLDVLK